MMLTRLAAAVFTGAGVGAALFAGSPLAHADQDPAADPPNCSAADLEGVRSGVSAATSAYLFTHPDVNYFYTSLEGLTRAQVAEKTKAYLNSHPDVQADMTNIRQPLIDIKQRCAAPPSP
ncbi:hemophore-related protein [Mycobacterium sp. OAS707]|nr:heme-binding protein [Mycobacterium sp. OAS707]MBE1547433.1 hemophore-related protein [Mycobacterium sp. OAS707]